MSLGYITGAGRGAADRCLAAFAEEAKAKGVRLAGIVQDNVECADSELCDMDAVVLPDGPVIRISQSLGEGSRGCRLDPEALETSVAAVEARLRQAPRPDLLIVNKFGKHEAGGRGYRPVIAEALAAGIPVLTAVNPTNHDAFLDFAGDLAEPVAAQPDALWHWLQAARADAA
ncbi:DUF2478 domain-containing protein [Chachezhania antarctica]|uniref:DUF2478 domain-containing protein n=1 Tax=Chachezhania antarctica TaxID=2340860 RepID=UPI000EB08A32|nr:DUF2478 domain-containing protein [Chachezhania antarctica]|tara:strand:+ start:1739 stop:2257 length:519 start_codon:yes stop_codon:yes gene_type:complete